MHAWSVIVTLYQRSYADHALSLFKDKETLVEFQFTRPLMIYGHVTQVHNIRGLAILSDVLRIFYEIGPLSNRNNENMRPQITKRLSFDITQRMFLIRKITISVKSAW